MANLVLVIGNKNYSSWSLRPWLAMKQLGVNFQEVRIPLYRADSAALLRQYSPSGKVPTLVQGNVTVWDSLAILEHLMEQFPALPWLPAEPRARAIARSICAEMHSSFLALRQHLPMNIRARYPDVTLTPTVQTDLDRITTLWRTCRSASGNTGDLLFGSFTLADAMYAPVALRFITYNVALDPICRAYAEAIVALPAMREWIAAAQAEPETIADYEFD